MWPNLRQCGNPSRKWRVSRQIWRKSDRSEGKSKVSLSQARHGRSTPTWRWVCQCWLLADIYLVFSDQMYWEKRLERAPKNVLNDSLFREELKKTTPPPSRKGGGEQYKPTTSRPEQYKPRTKTPPVFTRKRKTYRSGAERHYKPITASANTRLGDRIRLQGTQTPARHQADSDNTCKTVYLRRHYVNTPELTSNII